MKLKSLLVLSASIFTALSSYADTNTSPKVSGYMQFRLDSLSGDPMLFNNSGSGGQYQRPTTLGPSVGGPSNGFLVRRGRMKIEGPKSNLNNYVFQLDFGNMIPVNLRDAYVDLHEGMPKNTFVRVGQFPPPFTYILPYSSRLRESPDRPYGFSDSNYSAILHKNSVSQLGGEFTPGSVVPLFLNQDREIGLQISNRYNNTSTSFGLFNGEGRDTNGQRPLNSNLTFIGRIEQKLPQKNGNIFFGISKYDGAYSVRSSSPVNNNVTPFTLADRSFTNIDSRWESKDGWIVRGEYLWGKFETTPDRSVFLKNNDVQSYYLTLTKNISNKTTISSTFDVFKPINKTLSNINPTDYEVKTLQGGILHHLSDRTRLRLWYVRSLSDYDPSAAQGSYYRSKVNQIIGEIQIEF